MSQAWQQPYVNIFKHFGVGEWQKCGKEGDVSKLMDRNVKGSVYKITGSLPSGNYIHFPKSRSASLGLRGHYLYVLFKPVEKKYFSIHLDVASSDGVTVRISLSNIFHELKTTSTWIQLPVVSNPRKGSVEEATHKNLSGKDKLGSLPSTTRWTLMSLNMQYILSMYLNKHFSHVKNLRLCSNMLVKNTFTSSTSYTPGLDITFARKTGMLASGVSPLPRDMSFPNDRHEDWHQKYDYIIIPSSPQTNDDAKKSDITKSKQSTGNDDEKDILKKVVEKKESLKKANKKFAEMKAKEKRIKQQELQKDLERTVEKLNESLCESTKALETSDKFEDLPVIENEKKGSDGIHIFASPRIPKTLKKVNEIYLPKPLEIQSIKHKNVLLPDPTLRLEKIVGFGSSSCKKAFASDVEVFYPSHSAIVACNTATGRQNFMLGHTDPISAVTLSPDACLFVSVQQGDHSVVRVWASESKKCLALVQTSFKDISLLSVSPSSQMLCAVGSDQTERQVIGIWNISQLMEGKVEMICKAHTELNETIINYMQFSHVNDLKLISCGLHNIRVWRIKANSLRSCPVELGDFYSVEFTCLTMMKKYRQFSILATSTSGLVYEVDYNSLKLSCIHRLSDVSQSKSGVALTSISVDEEVLVTGNQQGLVQVWTKDFKTVLIEASHDHSISYVQLYAEGSHVLIATQGGSLGILDITNKHYTTLARSHSDQVLALSFEVVHQHVATVSADASIKLWNGCNYTQVYDFQAPGEHPLCICCHPKKAEFVCGFRNGVVRVFALATMSVSLELAEHKEPVTTVLFSPSGQFLYTASSQEGSLVLYNVLAQTYDVLRELKNVTRRPKESVAPGNFVTLDDQGERLAVIGPWPILITVYEAKSLDELLHIDITTLHDHRYTTDDATIIKFSPSHRRHLLVVTEQSRLLKLDVNTGQILQQIGDFHNAGLITNICVSPCGKYIVFSASQNCLKVFDYNLKKSQTFVGHSSRTNDMQFSQDGKYLLTCAQTLFVWKFLNNKCGEMDTKENIDELVPRSLPPRPSDHPKDLLQRGDLETTFEELNVEDELSNATDEQLSPEAIEQEKLSNHVAPRVTAHYIKREVQPTLPAQYYAPPTNQAGVQLKGCVGCNGRGRKNVGWHPESGLFVYTMGVVVVVEDLTSTSQQHLLRHTEEISTLALRNDGTGLATASCYSDVQKYAAVCIWQLSQGKCVKVLEDHQSSIVAMQYSRDDRYLTTVGDYRECAVFLWDTTEYVIVGRVTTPYPVHALSWQPYAAYQLATVGQARTVYFWTFDQAKQQSLQYTEGFVPHNVFSSRQQNQQDMTSLCYYDREWLLTATMHGVVLLWSLKEKACVIHWSADTTEIDVLLCGNGKLMTAGCSKKLRVWSLAFIEDLTQFSSEGLQVEFEKELDSPVTSAVFDDVMEVGVVSTAYGTIWCVTLNNEEEIQIVNSHHKQITSLAICSGDEKFITTTSADGGLRLWNLETREKMAQFQVMGQPASCVVFLPHAMPSLHPVNNVFNKTLYPLNSPLEQPTRCVTGYGDGTLRVFDFAQMEMVMKLKPQINAVTQLLCSPDGLSIMSADVEGLIYISSLETGVTSRIINEHKGAPIRCLRKHKSMSSNGTFVWLASSEDCRISVWRSDWSRDVNDLVDWLTFPKHVTDENVSFPCVAEFLPDEPDSIVYSGFSVTKEICVYSLTTKQVTKRISVNDWVLCMAVSPSSPNLLAMGLTNRLMKLVDVTEGTFQDYVIHSDAVTSAAFSKTHLVSCAFTEMFVWDVLI